MRSVSDIESNIRFVERKISDLQTDVSSIESALSNYEMRSKEQYTQNYNNWRNQRQSIHAKHHELEYQISFYEREKNRFAEQVRYAEREIADAERENNHRQKVVLERKRDNAQSEFDYNEREWYAKKDEFSSLSGDYVTIRRDYLDEKIQIANIYNDLVKTDKANLRGKLQEIKQLDRELDGLKNELSAAKERKEADELKEEDRPSHDYSDHDRYLDTNPDSWDTGVDDNDLSKLSDEEYIAKYVNANLKEEHKDATPVELVPIKELSPANRARKNNLVKYSKDTNQKYTEFKSISGYRAQVGKTRFFYREDGNMSIYREEGIPSIEDMKVAFAQEKALGKNAIPIGHIDDPEYLATAVIASDAAGIKAIGKVRLDKTQIEKLDPKLRVRYKQILDKFDKQKSGFDQLLNSPSPTTVRKPGGSSR